MNRRILALPLTASLLLLFAVTAQAATISPTRFDDPGGAGDCPTDCSLRQALASSASGDTIQLAAGTYAVALGPLQLDKALTLRGVDARLTKLDANQNSRVIEKSGALSTIEHLSIVFGRAAAAGGIHNQSGALLVLDQVTMSGNQAFSSSGTPNGGAIWNEGALQITRSTFRGNHADSLGSFGAVGGAIDNKAAANLNIDDSTFSDNYVSAGDPTYGPGGGAIFAEALSTVQITNSTIASNGTLGAAQLGGNIGDSPTASIVIANSIVADGLGAIAGGRDCSIFAGTLTSLGGNVESTDQCGFPTPASRVNADAALGSLGADGGGETDAMKPGAGSAALGFGLLSKCNLSSVDQRGGKRVLGGACDSGSVQHNGLSGLSLSASVSLAKLDSPPVYKLTVVNAGPDDATNVIVRNGVSLVATTGTNPCFAGCALGDIARGETKELTLPGDVWTGTDPVIQAFAVTSDQNQVPEATTNAVAATPAPRIASAKLASSSFAAASIGPAFGIAKKRAKTSGTLLTYDAPEATTLTVSILKNTKGVRKHGKCVARHKHSHGKHCTFAKVLQLSAFEIPGGEGRLRISGRAAGHRLKRGSYMLSLTPTNAALNGRPVALAFRIKR